ncbi:MAG: hypothetical protein D3910_15610 [Candidatus Electrothrix sp. ATG2]|nr:hypothetical protein [Candidatus Electrothrix sp. ATG2]
MCFIFIFIYFLSYFIISAQRDEMGVKVPATPWGHSTNFHGLLSHPRFFMVTLTLLCPGTNYSGNIAEMRKTCYGTDAVFIPLKV